MASKGLTKEQASAQIPADFGYDTGTQGIGIKAIPKDTPTGSYFEMRDDAGHFLYNSFASTEGEALEQARTVRPWANHPNPAYDLVPDRPFKSSNDWGALSLKRMIKYAADNGYDQIAWTPGQVQADRYDLSKQVDNVMAFKRDDGNFDLMVRLKGERGQQDVTGISQQKLAETVGKELADKIISQPPKWQTYSGGDLKIGGEGMKAFYDKMLPNIANKIGKKFGAKVGTTRIAAEHNPFPNDPAEKFRKNEPITQQVHSLPITPAMRTQAQTKGFPLFTSGAAPVGQKKDDLNSILEELNQFKQ